MPVFVGARQLVRQDGGSGGPFYGAQPLQPTQTRAPTGERLQNMASAYKIFRLESGDRSTTAVYLFVGLLALLAAHLAEIQGSSSKT